MEKKIRSVSTSTSQFVREQSAIQLKSEQVSSTHRDLCPQVLGLYGLPQRLLGFMGRRLLQGRVQAREGFPARAPPAARALLPAVLAAGAAFRAPRGVPHVLHLRARAVIAARR